MQHPLTIWLQLVKIRVTTRTNPFWTTQTSRRQWRGIGGRECVRVVRRRECLAVLAPVAETVLVDTRGSYDQVTRRRQVPVDAAADLHPEERRRRHADHREAPAFKR